jgi:RNA polymerase-binding transcription factor
MKKKELKLMKEKLIAEKANLLQQAIQEVDVDMDGDETDEIQGKILLQLTNQLNTRNISKLSKIESALQRIEDNTYGLCLDCEEPIADKRLLSNPYFQTCIDCAEEREAEEQYLKKVNK